MSRKLLSLPSMVTRCMSYQNCTKLRFHDLKISSCCHSSYNSGFSEFETKSNRKKKKLSTSKNKITSAKDVNLSEFAKNDNMLSSEEIAIKRSEELSEFGEISNSSLETGRLQIKKKKKKETKKKLKNKSTEMNEGSLSEKEMKLKLLQESLQTSRIQSFNHSLASYIYAAMFCGYFKTAYNTFKYYKKFDPEIFTSRTLNIKPYNEVLKGISNQGDLTMMKEVLGYLKDSSLKPDYNTVAYCLTCLGRNSKLSCVVGEINDILELMNQHNITLDEIFGHASLSGDSLQYCLQAVEMVIPNVKKELKTFNPTKESLMKQNCYDNNLVNDLNDSIFMKRVKSPIDGIITKEKLSELIQKQINLELKGYVEIPTICENKITEDCEKHEVDNLCMVSETYSFSYSRLASELGAKFYKRFQIKYKERAQFLPALIEVYENYCHWYLHPSDQDSSYIPRVQWKILQSKMIHRINFKDTTVDWPYTVNLGVGKILYNFIVSSVKVWRHEETEEYSSPAFYKVQRNYDARTVEEIKPSPILTEVLEGANRRNSITFSTTMLPMLSPPVPWSDTKNGGYILTEVRVYKSITTCSRAKASYGKGGNAEVVSRI
ncbi:hypothetical protein Anas_09076 [Armadillidium nasatum]|uniref:DNA-directed RNA polymerase N-terminal domain-containing protein n=1 Tax=Armadillidium nasatum TaxID=96803 RepID=A0A5N5SQ43_9CRUS|nr:hypothetical protein Anas_09076 [Armadillidium nasatum]